MHRKYVPDEHEHHHGHGHGSGPGLPRWLLPLAVAAALVAWAATSVYVVQPNERAVVWRCGKIVAESGPGIHLGFPYGIDRITRLKMFEQKMVGIGQDLNDRDRGRAADPRRAECLTGDRNLIAVPAIVQYDIVHAKDYLSRTGDVSAMIENLTRAALSTVVASMPVDDVFTVGRLEIQQKVLAAVKQRLAQLDKDGQGLGVQINSMTLQEVLPPGEVKDAFGDVLAAREDRQRAINEAEGYANALLPTARGEAERVRLLAEGYKVQVVKQSRGEADRFNNMVAKLSRGRALTVKRLVLETLEEVLPRVKKVVLDQRAGKQLDLGLIQDEP
jgi:modulator of FtsH protease HflK